MNKSESIAELAAAMSKFQGDTNNAFKGKAGHGYNYADLAAILEQSRPLLASNELSVIQMPCEAPSGFVGVETCVCHSSGQFIEQRYSMAIPENKRNSQAQNIGSAITYARRYAIAAALGVAQTDTDASEKPTYTVDDSATGWIDAVKADSAVLNQITDAGYRAFIKEQAGV